MKKRILVIFLMCVVLLLVACQGNPLGLKSQAAEEDAETAAPPTATIQRLPTFTVTPYPTRTPVPADPIQETVRTYFNALEAQDSQKAAAAFSNYSLMVNQVTRGEAAGQLQARFARGEQWSGLEVQETRPLDDLTTLVHVTYRLEGKNEQTGALEPVTRDEWWPLRNENGQWFYNLDNLIDFRTLEVTEQTTGGLTIKPRQLTRYADRTILTLLVQNQTNESIVLGQQNEVLASFLFGEAEKVEAEPVQFIFQRLHSYPETELVIQGLFETYPDGVIIRQWKNVQVEPWYTFDFNQ